jgi:hypothetical protein
VSRRPHGLEFNLWIVSLTDQSDRIYETKSKVGDLKALVVIGLIILLLVLLYRRLRPYRELINEFFRTLRHFQQAASAPKQKSEKLVCCETCGTWIPAGRAIGSGDTFFCSQECRRKPEITNRRQRKGGR